MVSSTIGAEPVFTIEVVVILEKWPGGAPLQGCETYALFIGKPRSESRLPVSQFFMANRRQDYFTSTAGSHLGSKNMITGNNMKKQLLSLSRDHLNAIALKLGVHNFRRAKKKEVADLLSTHPDTKSVAELVEVFGGKRSTHRIKGALKWTIAVIIIPVVFLMITEYRSELREQSAAEKAKTRDRNIISEVMRHQDSSFADFKQQMFLMLAEPDSASRQRYIQLGQAMLVDDIVTNSIDSTYVYIGMGDFQNALFHLRSASAMPIADTTMAEIMGLKAAIYVELGDTQNAHILADSVININSNSGMAWLVTGYVHYRLRRLDTALRSFDRSLSLLGGSAPIWLLKGITLSAMGRFENAVIAFDSAGRYSLNSNESIEAWYRQAECNIFAGKPERALRCYDSIIKYDSANWTAWYGAGLAYVLLGDIREAKTKASVAMRLSPDSNMVKKLIDYISKKEKGEMDGIPIVIDHDFFE